MMAPVARVATPLPGSAGAGTAVDVFLDTLEDAIVQATAAPALVLLACEAAVQRGAFLTAFLASPNASVGWLTVEAAAGFQAARLRDIRFLAKELPGDPWSWLARAWRHRAASGPEPAVAWPVLQQHAPEACGLAIPVPRRHAPADLLVVFAARAADLDGPRLARLQRAGGLLGLALDKLLLEAERAASGQEVRQAEQKYRAILDTIEDAYYEVDVRGKPVYHNAAFSRMLGYEPGDPITTDNRVRQTPEMAARVFRAFNDVYLTGVPRRNEEWEYLHKQGHRVQVEGSVQLVRDAHGQPVGFRGMLRDVTERRRMEAHLRDSEARFRALTGLSSDWYWEQDAAHHLVRIENRHARTDALQRGFLGRPVWDSGLALHAVDGWEAHRQLLQAHQPFRDVIMRGTLRNGRPFWLSASGEPVFDDAGVFAGYRGVAREVSAQKDRLSSPLPASVRGKEPPAR